MKTDRGSDFDKDEHRVPFGYEAFHEDEFDERWGELNSFLSGPLGKGIGPHGFKGVRIDWRLAIGKASGRFNVTGGRFFSECLLALGNKLHVPMAVAGSC